MLMSYLLRHECHLDAFAAPRQNSLHIGACWMHIVFSLWTNLFVTF